MSFTIRLLIWFKGKFVGSDSFGNRYYEEKHKSVYGARYPRRWVIYKSDINASTIPPEWQAWLHYRANMPLNGKVFDLQHEIIEDTRVVKITTKAKRSYQPWIPNE